MSPVRRASTPSRTRTLSDTARVARRDREERSALGFYAYSVRDVMTRAVAVAHPEDPLAEAARRMSRRQVSGLPVIDRSRRLVGVLSEKDIVRVLANEAGFSVPGSVFDLLLAPASEEISGLADRCRAALERIRVRRAMTRPALSVTPGTPVLEAEETLLTHGINRLPVVERGRLVGIVTRGDLLERPSRESSAGR